MIDYWDVSCVSLIVLIILFVCLFRSSAVLDSWCWAEISCKITMYGLWTSKWLGKNSRLTDHSVTMELLTSNANVTGSSAEANVTAPNVFPLSSSPMNLVSSASYIVHSGSRLSDRRWSAPDNCSVGGDSVEASHQYCHSANVMPPSKRMSNWETVESDVVSVQPATRLMYSGISSHASLQHHVLSVSWWLDRVFDTNVFDLYSCPS